MSEPATIQYEYRDLTPEELAVAESPPPGFRRTLRRIVGELIWWCHYTPEAVQG